MIRNSNSSRARRWFVAAVASTVLFAHWYLLLAPCAARADEPPRGPLAPAAEAAVFRLADDRLTVELAAAEPDVNSPVAVAWDADGRMYVAEMIDYPVGPRSGRIRQLVDADGDGRYERSTVFADELNFPNGVLCWQGGVFVTAAPDLLYLCDTDGDGRADERRVVFTGFAEGNQQLRANGLVWGLDNWIYGANGRSDGEIRHPKASAGEAVSIRTRDFRFLPDGSRFEAIPGQSQFGQTRDDWGRRFLSWNTIPIRHALLDPETLAAHPRLGSQAIRDIADPADRGRVFAISPRPQTFNREATDYYNALAGLSIYRGDALGDDYRGNAFVGESLTNLVHRRVLKPDGPTFVSLRGEADREFLAGSDPWFHPVNTATGPDGALYIVDFYRRWVEHPQFVAESLRGGVDWREGAGNGRIWRIRRRESGERPPQPRLSEASVAELVTALGHANGWRRDTAQRLLVERGDLQAVPLLRDTVRRGASPLARAHALWTLEALGAVDESVLLLALADRASEVREQALRLAARRSEPSAGLAAAISALAGDASLAVRFRLAFSLDAQTEAGKLTTLARLARQPDASPWLVLALAAALDERLAWPFLQRLVADDASWLREPTAERAALLRQTAALLRDEPDVLGLLSFVERLNTDRIGAGHLALVAGLTRATLARDRSLREWLAAPAAERKAAKPPTAKATAAAERVATDDDADLDRRVDAVIVLRLADPPPTSLLEGLLAAHHPQEVQSAAAATLAVAGDAETARRMLSGWATYTTATRQAVAAAALRRPAATVALVEALEQGDVLPIELDPGLRDALGAIRDAALRQRAQKALVAAAPEDRQAVLARYRTSLETRGDRSRGGALFRQHCLTCHALEGVGHRVGADLSGVGSRPKPSLLEDLLDPSRQVSPNFLAYTLVTDDGQVLSGLLALETTAAVTLRRAEGLEDTVPRGRIEQLRAAGKSLMPEGFEQKLSVQDVADLLEFLVEPDRELLGADIGHRE